MSAASDIVDRIAKLLRLAKSSNPHEAAAALAKAMELAAEHRVALESIPLEEAETAKRTAHRDTDPFARLSYDRKYACIILRRFFRVRVIHRGAIVMRDGLPAASRKISFVGQTADLEIALYVYAFLLAHFTYCWSHHRGRLRSRPSFVRGMFEGIFSKLYEAEAAAGAARTGTELAESFGHYISLHFGPTEQMKNRLPDADASAARYRGYVHGRKTEIRTPLKAGGEEGRLLLG